MANSELLRSTMAYIESHVHEWDQFAWAHRGDCGTAMCFAGWAVTLAGAEVDFTRFGDESSTSTITPASQRELGLRSSYIDEAARELLDLSLDQSEELFCASNSMERLRMLVDELAAGGGDA